MSRSLLDSEGAITVSSLWDPKVNADGSVDIYFGPTAAPKGKEKNWIRTDAEKDFFRRVSLLWSARGLQL